MNKAENIVAGENIIAGLQGHWMWLLRPVGFLLIGGLLGVLFFHVGRVVNVDSAAVQFLFYCLSFTVISVSVHAFFIMIFQWAASTVILTDQRIIEIKYAPFVIDDISHISLSKINDIEKRKHGIVKNLLNYGEVCMGVAGMHTDIHIDYVRKPSKFVNLVEAVKLGKPLQEVDLRGMGASFSDKYRFLEKI